MSDKGVEEDWFDEVKRNKKVLEWGITEKEKSVEEDDRIDLLISETKGNESLRRIFWRRWKWRKL